MAQPSCVEQHPILAPTPHQIPRPKNVFVKCSSTHLVHKTLATAANLANLLPTGTVLAFRTLMPSFTNKGRCQPSNRLLTASLIILCSILCFFSSFTDSFIDCEGKLWYGIATFKGLYIFNKDDEENHDDEETQGEDMTMKELSKYRLRGIDFVHAFMSLSVFLVHALSDSDVQSCFFPHAGENMDVLMMNLPLGAGVFSSFLFTIFPTTRRGVGYADLPSSSKIKSMSI